MGCFVLGIHIMYVWMTFKLLFIWQWLVPIQTTSAVDRFVLVTNKHTFVPVILHIHECLNSFSLKHVVDRKILYTSYVIKVCMTQCMLYAKSYIYPQLYEKRFIGWQSERTFKEHEIKFPCTADHSCSTLVLEFFYVWCHTSVNFMLISTALQHQAHDCRKVLKRGNYIQQLHWKVVTMTFSILKINILHFM